MSWTSETNIKGPKGDKGDKGDPGASGTGTGDVIGPAGAVADRIAVYSGTTGKIIKDGGKLISELGSGVASGITVTPAGNISSTNVQAALVELDNEKVAKTGDTMTGLLLLSADPGSAMGAVTKQYADAADALKAPLASPVFTGDPRAPTPATADSDTSVATTAFVKAQNYGDVAGPAGAVADRIAVFNGTTGKLIKDGGQTVATLPGAVAVRYDIAQGLTAAQQLQARQNISAPLRGQLAGLTLSTAGSSATFGIAAGEAADSTAAALMQLAGAYTKTTAAWAAGSGSGALDTGAIVNLTWYHVFLIRRPDTGVVDVVISATATPANGPTLLPANYTQFRRIGAMKTNASAQWVGFNQKGDEFLWLVPVNDVATAVLGTAATLFTLTVPPGVQVWAYTRGYANCSVTTSVLLTSPDENVAAVNIPSGNITTNPSAGVTFVHPQGQTRTSTSAQVRAVAGAANTTLLLATYGWTDRRGRDD
jgi:hypothetical protein